MSSMNKAIIIGRLGTDPELRYTDNGTPVANLSLATSIKWSDKNGEAQEKTEWHRVVVWNKQAENCHRYLSKGRQVAVEGRIETRKWEDDKGNDRYTTEIIAQSVTFLGTKDDNQNQANGQQRQNNNRQQNNNRGQNDKRKNPKYPPHGSGGSQFDADDIPF